jgi:hypothetical protein
MILGLPLNQIAPVFLPERSSEIKTNTDQLTEQLQERFGRGGPRLAKCQALPNPEYGTIIFSPVGKIELLLSIIQAANHLL